MANEQIKEAIREHYGRIATTASSCCGPNCGCGDDEQYLTVLMSDDYKDADQKILEAADLGLGCGTPTAFTDLKPGMTVLDLGSGAGIDVFLAAQQVAPTGKAIGLDMTDEMLERARANQVKLGITNAEFRRGEIENMPVESSTVDRIISNCVINLVPDKTKAFLEMYRVLKPGGSFTVSDIVTIGTIPEEVKKDLDLWAGCVSGAVEKDEYLRIIREAGFADIKIVSEKTYPTNSSLPFSIRSITVRGTK